MAKLKVFTANLGFFETVVAVPSKAAALKAWGTRQDLFAPGTARQAEDDKAVAAAIAHPGVVLRRPVGSSAAFSEDADVAGLDLPKVKTAKPTKGKAKAAKPAPPPPDRSRLDAAQKALTAREARYRRERDVLNSRRRALEAELDQLRETFDGERKALEEERRRAQSEYRKAGGAAG